MNTIHGRWNDAADAVILIDAHHYLWDLRQNRHPWLCGDEQKEFFMGDYSPLRRDYLPQDYLRGARGHNVLTTVHCEAEWDRADQVGETRWLTEIHKKHGFPGAIVAHAWFHTGAPRRSLPRRLPFPWSAESARNR
jgi:predicted TIM-barrel fold metal-dependent hydrolase